MSRIKAILALGTALAAVAASGPALAWGHARLSFGVVVGAPFYPWNYPPYYYLPYPPVVVVPAAPTTYVEQGSAHPGPAQRSYWYYCEASKTYYPYVKECAAGWLRVVPQATPHTAPQSTPQKTPQAAPQTAPG
jgi:hypothetical protein